MVDCIDTTVHETMLNMHVSVLWTKDQRYSNYKTLS